MKNENANTETKFERDLTSKPGWNNFVKASKEVGVLDKSQTARPSIMELKDRKLRFVIRVKIGSSEFRGAYATREEAEQAATDIESLRKEIPAVRNAKTFRVKGGEYKTLMTLAGLMRLWFEAHTEHKPSTKIGLYSVFNRLIAPTLGCKMLHQIEETEVEEILVGIKNKGQSAKTAVDIRTCLSHLDKIAGKKLKYPKEYRLQFIPVEVLQGYKFKEVAHHKAVSPEELGAVIKAMFEVMKNPTHNLNEFTPYIYLLASLTGLRNGEARALIWGDITSEALTVKRTISKRGIQTDTVVNIIGIETPVQKIAVREYLADSPKTYKSRRTIPLNYELKIILPEIRTLWIKLMKRQPKDDDFVFCIYRDIKFNKEHSQARKSRLGDFIGCSNFGRSLRRYFKNAQLKELVTMHQLRASFATILLRTSPNPSTALVNMKALLGHDDINTTSIYAQSDNKEKQQMVDSMPSFLNRDGKSKEPENLDIDNMTKAELLSIIKKLQGQS